MIAFAKIRLHNPFSLLAGVFVGGLIVSISFLVWYKLGHGSTGKESSLQYQYPNATTNQINAPMPVYSELAQSNEYASDYEFSVSLYTFLAGMDEKSVLLILEQSNRIKSKSRQRSIQAASYERLVEINPKVALEHVQKHSGQNRVQLLETVFHHWSLLDWKAAVAAGESVAHPLRKIALRTILHARNDLSEPKKRELGLRFGEENLVSRLIEEETWLRHQSNEDAWKTIVGDGKQLTKKTGLLVEIAVNWWRQESDGTLQRIVEATNPGADHWNSEKYVVLRTVVQALTQYSPLETFKQARDLTDPSRDALLFAVATQWSKSSPHEALTAVSDYEHKSPRKFLSRVVSQNWARSHPEELLESIGMYSREVQAVATEEAILSIGRMDRHEAIRVMEKAGQGGFNSIRLTTTFFDEWSAENPRAAVNWIVSNKQLNGRERMQVLEIILQNLVQVDWRFAVDVALAHRSTDSLKEIEATVIGTLAYKDVEAAISLLPKIRKETLPATLSLIGGALVYHNNPMRALDLANQLAERQRSNYFSTVLNQWALHNPRLLFESIGTLPSEELKTVAARTLTRTHPSNPELSHKELDYIKTYFSEE